MNAMMPFVLDITAPDVGKTTGLPNPCGVAAAGHQALHSAAGVLHGASRGVGLYRSRGSSYPIFAVSGPQIH